MSKTLFIIAAGLSTRFNGNPKHLAFVDSYNESVLGHTLRLAKSWYERIYVVVNSQAQMSTVTCTKEIANAYGAEVIEIPSGKGDADAVYRALVKTGQSDSAVSICWGDAWFKDDSAFCAASNALNGDSSKTVFEAFCAIEDHPYGWFKLEQGTNVINEAVFKNDQSIASTKIGTIHDQCFFNINVNNFKRLFEAYEKAILSQKTYIENKIASNYCSVFKFSIHYEVSWYKMINWAHFAMPECHSIAHLLDQPVAMSFNTEEELEEIDKNA